MVLATKKNCLRVLAGSLRVVSAMTGNPPLASLAGSRNNFLSSYGFDKLMNIGLAGLSNRGS